MAGDPRILRWRFFYGLFYGGERFGCKMLNSLQRVTTAGLPEYPAFATVFDAVKKRVKKVSNCESPALIAELQLRLACVLRACCIPVTDPESREIRRNFGLRIVHRGLGMKR
jgi:hypothetical protein